MMRNCSSAIVARFVVRFILSSKKDWQGEQFSPPCATTAPHHLCAPQFWDVGLGSQTARLQIVEMDYGLPWFS
jgi:hypothetical protein